MLGSRKEDEAARPSKISSTRESDSTGGSPSGGSEYSMAQADVTFPVRFSPLGTTSLADSVRWRRPHSKFESKEARPGYGVPRVRVALDEAELLVERLCCLHSGDGIEPHPPIAESSRLVDDPRR